MIINTIKNYAILLFIAGRLGLLLKIVTFNRLRVHFAPHPISAYIYRIMRLVFFSKHKFLKSSSTAAAHTDTHISDVWEMNHMFLLCNAHMQRHILIKYGMYQLGGNIIFFVCALYFDYLYIDLMRRWHFFDLTLSA